MEEKLGSIVEIIFHNEENGYTIAVMETKDEYFTAVGYLPTCTKGACYKLQGAFKVHPTYGEQFAFTAFEEILPTEETGIAGFLASGAIKGISPIRRRRRLWNSLAKRLFLFWSTNPKD